MTAPESIDPLQQAARWAVRLPDELSSEEEVQFQSWLAADPEHRKQFDALTRTLEDVDRFAGAPQMVCLRGAALSAARRSHDMMRARTFFASPPGKAAAAAFVAIAAVAAGAWLYLDTHIYKTGIGERRTVALSDGSGLSLDAATKVDVDISGDRRRFVLERGRAKFDVARDPLRPFTVEAGGKVIVALGTSFSVELIESQVHVVLYEGRVQVLQAGKPARRPVPGETTLAPGQQFIASQSSVQVAAIDPIRSLAWEGGDLAFADESLALAVERVNRYSKERIVIADPAAAAVRISGVFHAGDTEAFVDGITKLFPVRSRSDGGAIALSFDGKKTVR